MKIAFMSDIHSEFYDSNPLVKTFLPECDVFVFAGDIHTKPNSLVKFFKSFRKRTSVPIIYILGNHEYYWHIFPDAIKKYRNATKYLKDFYLLEKGSVKINDVTFVGATLWTNYDFGLGDIPAIINMNDHRAIRKNTGEYAEEYAMPCDFREEHEKTISFFKEVFSSEIDKSVLVTHHAPSYSSVPEEYLRASYNSAYCSDLTNFISNFQPNIWIHGHIHSPVDYMLGDTRVVSNPHCYPYEITNEPEFKIVEI